MGLVISKGLTLRRELPADAEADAYIAAVEAADGQALEPGVKFAIKNFVLCCKQDGIWDAIKASCILAGARTRLGALTPLVGTAPTSINFVDGDYNRKTGLVGDGSSKRLNANRAGSADPQNSSHLSVYATTATTQNKNYISLDSPGTGRKQITRPNDNPANLLTRSNSATRVDIEGAGAATGFIGINRASSTAYTFRAVSSTSTLSSTSDGVSANSLFVYGHAAFCDARIAFYSIGESLDLALLDARVTDLINAFAAAIP
jgi:hypothetical protein